MPYRRFSKDDIELRDSLALDRTRLANQRTLLAYVRTAIMVEVSAVSLMKLFPDSLAAQMSGWLLVPCGVMFAVMGLQRFTVHWRTYERLRE